MFRKDFAKQCGKWRKDKERLIIVLDANKPTMNAPLRKCLKQKEWDLRNSHTSIGTETLPTLS